MGKLRQWFINWFDAQLEKAFERQALKFQKEVDKMTADDKGL